VGNRSSLYINGVHVRDGLQSAQTVYLSKQFGDWGGYGYYHGLLDEIALYGRALSSGEISAIATAALHARCGLQ
jgi:hypothetical protein